MGKYQGLPSYTGTECTPCAAGNYSDSQGSAYCLPCIQPACAASIIACDATTGGGLTVTYFAPNTEVCGTARADDPCDKPEYCRADAATCDDAIDARWPLLWSDSPSCASDPEYGIDCWSGAVEYLAAPRSVHAAMPAGAGAWMGAGSATCASQPVTPRVRYFLASDLSGTTTTFSCPATVQYSTTWWGGSLATVATSPMTSNGTGYDFVLDGATIDALQGKVVFVIAQLYEPARDTAVAHACLQRLVIDSSPPLGAQLACPLTGSSGAALVEPAEPCFSELSGANGMRFVANGTTLPAVLGASATDPQSATLSATSGIASVSIRTVYAPPHSAEAALPAAPGQHCASETCASALLAQGWSAVSEFALERPLFGESTWTSTQEQAMAAGWFYEVVPQPPSPPSPPLALSSPSPTPPTAVELPVCSNECTSPRGEAMPHYANGVCDDGGPGSESDVCAYGTDCDDCGPRANQPPAAPPPDTITCCRQIIVEGATAIDPVRMGPFQISQTEAGLPQICASEGQQCSCQGRVYLGRKYRDYVRELCSSRTATLCSALEPSPISCVDPSPCGLPFRHPTPPAEPDAPLVSPHG